ncbi:hypothetical protein HMPREF0216_03287 [Clostridium celatum DSM 1785]|uniref:Uncharacterized protein n=2 Tax=Clostridium celatum TaxID=36834 RepID=L1Q2N9_9CLOT|nr:hypothetical protein HMPREF0216_03287 [Clostridium celatum DSM 1785]
MEVFIMIIFALLISIGIIYLITKEEEYKEGVLVPVRINPKEVIKEKFLSGQIDEITYYEMILKLENNKER